MRCHLLDPRWNGLFLIICQKGCFLPPRESNPIANNINPGKLAIDFYYWHFVSIPERVKNKPDIQLKIIHSIADLIDDTLS